MLRLKPAFALALLIVIGLAAAFVAHVRRPVPLQTKIESRVIPPSAPFDSGIRAPTSSAIAGSYIAGNSPFAA